MKIFYKNDKREEQELDTKTKIIPMKGKLIKNEKGWFIEYKMDTDLIEDYIMMKKQVKINMKYQKN